MYIYVHVSAPVFSRSFEETCQTFTSILISCEVHVLNRSHGKTSWKMKKTMKHNVGCYRLYRISYALLRQSSIWSAQRTHLVQRE